MFLHITSHVATISPTYPIFMACTSAALILLMSYLYTVSYQAVSPANDPDETIPWPTHNATITSSICIRWPSHVQHLHSKTENSLLPWTWIHWLSQERSCQLAPLPWQQSGVTILPQEYAGSRQAVPTSPILYVAVLGKHYSTDYLTLSSLFFVYRRVITLNHCHSMHNMAGEPMTAWSTNIHTVQLNLQWFIWNSDSLWVQLIQYFYY